MVITSPPGAKTGDSDRPDRPDKSAPPVLPKLGFVGTLRFIWRQLTSMRTALFLLMLLAVGAVPGSVFPQNRIDPSRVQAYIEQHPTSSPWLQRLGAFDVYASVWFSAIYLLLFISLVGCVVPRLRQHLKGMRALPPRTPRRLSRMRAHRSMDVHAPVDDVLDAAQALLRRRRYRVVRHEADGTALGASVSAEKGYLGETGNLLFHFSLLGLLFVLAAGSFLGYSGQAVVVAGKTWSNTVPLYNSFQAGRWVDSEDLPPFSVKLDSFKATFHETKEQFGEAASFEADVTYRPEPGAASVKDVIRVNHPLEVGGSQVYLVGNGYAPVVTVKDGNGDIAWSGPAIFASEDTMYTSQGVVKAPDAKPEGIGLSGIFLPTMGADPTTGQPISVFPDLRNPRLVFTAFTGDLNMNSGIPQSVYALDFTDLKQSQVTAKDGTKSAFSTMLAVGQSVDLPDGAGTVTFDGVQRYAAFNIRHDPTQGWALVFALAALIGLTLSLFVRPRRVWVRATAPDSSDGPTVVEIAGLPKRDSVDLAEETENLMNELTEMTEERAGKR